MAGYGLKNKVSITSLSIKSKSSLLSCVFICSQFHFRCSQFHFHCSLRHLSSLSQFHFHFLGFTDNLNIFSTCKLEDMNMNEAYEKVAVELAAQGVIGKRVDEMEAGFMMALDYMIQVVEKD
ncbi:uncharacterized protein LOC126688017 [Mercurialis annua]|uniref:uncharacterized protein LOC126688017 n=1 Tax=Mercurialis annua TaxID=3986 RepID=UPI0024AE84E8|nr:uncharacterized protein LOC126688017 [Mercurialis annua]